MQMNIFYPCKKWINTFQNIKGDGADVEIFIKD